MSEELFRDFWWLIFPVFGVVMAALRCSDGACEERVLRHARAELERAR